MNWEQRWINEVLSEIPEGNYRGRAAAELRDHLETQCRALMEAGRTWDEARSEALRVMGTPEVLQKEYMAAWRRSWPARLEELGRRLRAWAGGLAVMFGAQFLISYVSGTIWRMAISLPGNAKGPWVRAIRGAVGNLPLLCALIVGAFYLSRKFQTSRRPAALISAGLCVHWTYIAAFGVWWDALDDHRTFWEQLKRYLTHNAGYCSLFSRCASYWGRYSSICLKGEGGLPQCRGISRPAGRDPRAAPVGNPRPLKSPV